MPSGVYIRSIETRRKMSESRKGCNLSEETKRKISKVCNGLKRSEETKRRIGDVRKGKHLSDETKHKMSQAKKGLKHWNWKGGISNNGRWNFTDSDYMRWHKAVFQRDKWTCQQCEQVGGGLQAHHILSWAKYPELRFEISNGITLCKKCHSELHPKMRNFILA